MDVTAAASDMDAALRLEGDPERARNEQRYLKSDLAFYGVTVPSIRRIGKQFARANAGLDRDALAGVVEALWSEPVHERRALAVVLLEQHEGLLGAADIPLVERFLRESRTWALLDGLAVNVAGPLLDRTGAADEVLDRWAADEDFWLRRSALLAHLRALRAGDGDFDRFARYADAMLEEKEFFIRKAIGWVLRDTARKRPDLVYGWLAPRTHRASGVTVREAVKRLSPDQAETVMAAYREKQPAVSR